MLLALKFEADFWREELNSTQIFGGKNVTFDAAARSQALPAAVR
jgi:hypothetical protein